MLTRHGEVARIRDRIRLPTRCIGFGGGENEDPDRRFRRRWRDATACWASASASKCRPIISTPITTSRLRALLGDALVAEPTELIADLKLVKSPAELGYIRRAAALADLGMARFARRSRGRQVRAGAGRRRLRDRAGKRQRHRRQPDQSRLRSALGLSAMARRPSACCGRAISATSSSARPSAATPRRSAASSRLARRRRACSSSTTSCAAPPTP